MIKYYVYVSSRVREYFVHKHAYVLVLLVMLIFHAVYESEDLYVS